MTFMDEMFNIVGGPLTNEPDYEQWALAQYDDASPSTFTGQDASTLPSFEAAEAALSMFQNNMHNNTHTIYDDETAIDKYEWNSGIANNRNDNCFQHNQYSCNGLENGEQYCEESSPMDSPHEQPVADTSDARGKEDDLVKSLVSITRNIVKRNKVTKKRAKTTRKHQNITNDRLDNLEKKMSMIMQSLENQAISIADVRQTMAELSEKWEENWEQSEQKHGKHDDSLKVAFRVINLQTKTMSQLNSAKSTLEDKNA